MSCCLVPLLFFPSPSLSFSLASILVVVAYFATDSSFATCDLLLVASVASVLLQPFLLMLSDRTPDRRTTCWQVTHEQLSRYSQNCPSRSDAKWAETASLRVRVLCHDSLSTLSLIHFGSMIIVLFYSLIVELLFNILYYSFNIYKNDYYLTA